MNSKEYLQFIKEYTPKPPKIKNEIIAFTVGGFMGLTSELLLETWIRKNNIKYKEIKYRFIGEKHWFKKIFRFIMHKFIKKSRAFNG